MTSPFVQRTQMTGIMPASHRRRRTKRPRIKQKLVLHERQTRFLVVFLGAVAVLFVIARLIFLNSTPAQQFNRNSEISRSGPSPTPVDVNLKITEVTGS